ncbi:MAG: ATP-binding protein [Nostoc desertorum CM1-VF14]|jgi:DNA-binding Xre family transcriptional regulator|nr:ATP-binding protein [Nostoc desertorum CM1-VF14]
MTGRSLKASLKGIEQANKALTRNALGKKALALELGIARSTVHNFFSAKAVDRLNFEEICKRLGLDWKKIVDIPANESRTEQLQDTTINNNNFVGREEAITHLNNLVNEGAKVILIHAEGGIGKTTLATKWFELQGLEYLELRVGITPKNLNSVEDWLRLKLRYYFKENPEENFMIMLEQLKNQLQIRKIGVLIDNLEPALTNGKFIESQHSYYVELLTVLAHHSVQSVTLITSREQIDEHTLKRLQTFQTYAMEGLKQEVWQQYFEICHINTDSDALSQMHQAYGGNAEVMYILRGDIVTTSRGDLKCFWKKNCDYLLKNSTLENLVQYQFDKLQQDNPQVYNLLCRLGCYRYQYVPIIPEEGIFSLLWDEQNERDKHQLISHLKNRALVKFSEKGCYLYEVIREEAIERLKLTNDWKQCHAEAGIFLSTLISNSCQTIIPKIPCMKVNDTQEQTYLNIENAEIAVKQGLSKQENISLEVVYHVMEFYGVGCFEELRQEPKVLDNPFFKAIENMVFEYVDCYSNLGLVLYKLALSTQVLGIIDESEGNVIASNKEFDYYQRSFKVSQCFFQTALLMTTKVKEDKLMINLIRYLAECQDFTGIFLHQITKNNESKEAFDEIKVNLEKLVQIFDKLSFEQKIEEVKQAIHSLRINEQYYSRFIATFLA